MNYIVCLQEIIIGSRLSIFKKVTISTKVNVSFSRLFKISHKHLIINEIRQNPIFTYILSGYSVVILIKAIKLQLLLFTMLYKRKKYIIKSFIAKKHLY